MAEAQIGLVLAPHQPKNISFTPRSFGSKGEKCSFKPAWFEKWSWLHYREASDSVICFYCSSAHERKLLPERLYSKREDTYVTKGFTNWKDACASFRVHETSKFHVDAVQAMTKPQNDVGEVLSHNYSEEKKLNGRMLQTIMQNIQFLGRQGLALRGHDGGESNFIQLMKLRTHDQPEIADWLTKKADKYTSPEIQNEILALMATTILRVVAGRLQHADFFTIMADECVDCSNNEQLVVCFRYVDDDFAVHVEFLGLYMCPDIKANTIVKVLEDVLLRLNLKISRRREQCYDGGSNMAGSKNGVKSQILKQEPRALFMHCYGHALSLSVADTIKLIPLLASTMDTAHEISKMLQYSPKRAAIFKDVKAQISPDLAGFRLLCPTRWTVRSETFGSIIDNYDAFMEFWESVLGDQPDSETRARVNGLASQMKTFNFFFGVCLLHTVLRHADNLSKTLQHTKLSAAEGQHLAKMTVATLKMIRSEENFKLFWQKTVKQAGELDIGEPVLPRKRKAPKHLEVGSSVGTSSALPEDHYKAIYLEVVDTVTTCITNRFA